MAEEEVPVSAVVGTAREEEASVPVWVVEAYMLEEEVSVLALEEEACVPVEVVEVFLEGEHTQVVEVEVLHSWF